MKLPTLRDDAGNLMAYAWPGGYPIVYLTHDGCVLCPACANHDEDVERGDIYWEGSTTHCEDCDVDLPSAYGDPEEVQS